MCDSWSDGPSCYREKTRTARKLHKCCACGETVSCRHRYRYISGVWDGEPYSFKQCLRCAKIFDELMLMTDGVSITLNCGTTWEDAFDEAPPEHIAALAFALPSEVQP